MRKTQLALAAVALIASSAAMSANVSISGNLDLGIARTSGYNGTGGMMIEQGAYFDNQSINLNVSEDLGSGLKAHGSLGMGFNANGASDNPGLNRTPNNAAGNVPGAGTFQGGGSVMDNGLFNRQSYVGLSGEFGDIRLGKQLSPFIAAAAGNMHYVGMFGVGRLAMASDEGGASGTAGAFFKDDAIQYTTPSMSGFTANLMTTMRNSTNNNQLIIDRGRYSAFSVSGPVGPITINAAYQSQAFTGTPNIEYTGYLIGGIAQITDGISVSAGYISTKQGSAATAVANDNRTDSYNVGIGFDLSQATKLQAQYASSNVVANQSTTLMNIMLINTLSARTKLYAGLGYGNRVGATIGALGAQTGAGVVQNANTAAAPNNNGNSNVLNNGVASSNNAIVFGVAHSF